MRLSNYGPRTTSGPRGLPLWSLKKDLYHTIAENLSLEITLGNSLSLLPVLTFYEIYYHTRLPTTHSTLSNKRGVTVVLLAVFSLHIWHRACNPARDHPNS
jgi:hypothetical protein